MDRPNMIGIMGLFNQRLPLRAVIRPMQEHTMSFSFGDLFWIFFAFVALQPVIRQRVIDAMRARKILQIEQMRHSRVILLVHRQ
jgi:hypothetical protein